MSIVNQRELEDSLLDTGDAVVVPRREIPSIEFGKDAVGHRYVFRVFVFIDAGLPLLIDGHAVSSHIKSANLYERRLVFELGQLREPSEAAKLMMHKVLDTAAKGGQGGYIAVPQLADIFRSLSLNMTNREIELLANGFGSNGKGGVMDARVISVKQFLN
jgi:hypothetical protein